MSDAIEDSSAVEWIRDLFADATADSMIRWMLAAWLVLTLILIGLDRLSAVLLGRSRPLVQEPPLLARTWRWRRRSIPPADYSLLPSGTLADEPLPAAVPISIPLVSDADLVIVEKEVDPLAALDRPAVPDDEYWEGLVSITQPLFGYENNSRLELGRPPERFNPLLGRVERLVRTPSGTDVEWPGSTSADTIRISFDDVDCNGAPEPEQE